MSGEPNILPALRYADAAKAWQWLHEAFGFEQRFSVPGPDGTIAHAEMGLGAGTIMFGSASRGAGALIDPDPRKAEWTVYVWVPDIDAHYERARRAGAEITTELAGTDYGSREYGARDFEGNHWAFGTYLPRPE
ncbi:putative glyoxalase superfamily protein PhnB [Saccharopolyspora erythraea NRRL 2338]|uniref:Glyoxalase/bleomycin resistance protein/dioxygenase n=2 Tax=Saccharopolyspora erythraea TaxID=1836 RepID=A4FB97_SACEN|nr:VOC family protein [Saccharopolyspora erythraea]EQD86495.1 glyoxalase [Saccharopolyspora erythraea D]PFG95104.1 putative glyoxalase superfamily protein PhnB [Saccharopolyspora erythraea NRRL 2338]QRK91779.1 VOC family protein [Saccharopolyspora erythraea]CAM01322.1 glyoxalase/bleomycin resistance protein/dioxygenase [Saccharopolyspora erythraea NRRL 2338]